MKMDEYIDSHTSAEPPILKKIYRQTHLKLINSRMVSGHVQGRFLAFISRLVKPKRVLEIGTFTGYSALCLAEGLQHDGKLFTIEVDDELEDVIRQNIEESTFTDQIGLIIGNALDIIPTFDGNFDLVFIDGHKPEYPDYLAIVKPKLAIGAVVIADNVLWDGKVFDPSQNDESTLALRKFNRMVHEDADFENVLLPLRDGLMVFRYNPQ